MYRRAFISTGGLCLIDESCMSRDFSPEMVNRLPDGRIMMKPVFTARPDIRGIGAEPKIELIASETNGDGYVCGAFCGSGNSNWLLESDIFLKPTKKALREAKRKGSAFSLVPKDLKETALKISQISDWWKEYNGKYLSDIPTIGNFLFAELYLTQVKKQMEQGYVMPFKVVYGQPVSLANFADLHLIKKNTHVRRVAGTRCGIIGVIPLYERYWSANGFLYDVPNIYKPSQRRYFIEPSTPFVLVRKRANGKFECTFLGTTLCTVNMEEKIVPTVQIRLAQLYMGDKAAEYHRDTRFYKLSVGWMTKEESLKVLDGMLEKAHIMVAGASCVELNDVVKETGQAAIAVIRNAHESFAARALAFSALAGLTTFTHKYKGAQLISNAYQSDKENVIKKLAAYAESRYMKKPTW